MTHDDGRRADPDLSLTSPDALVAALPYLLGFQPAESIVLIWLSRGRVALTERLDLPPEGIDLGDWPHLASWLEALTAPLAHIVVDEAIAVLVSARPDLDGLAGAIEQMAEEEDVHLRDLLRLDGDRWWSYLCASNGCCPAEGRPVDESARLRIAAEFALGGAAPMASRDALAQELRRDKALARELRAARAALPAWASRRPPGDEWRDHAIAAILAHLVPDDHEASLRQAAAAESCMGDVRVRDTVLWEAGHLEAVRLRELAAVMRQATAGGRPGRRAATATAAAICAWLEGDGARAVTGIETALEADADYSLAGLVSCALHAGLPPQTWRDSMAGLPRSVVRGATAPGIG